MNIFDKIIGFSTKDRAEELKKLLITKKISKEKLDGAIDEVLKEMNLSEEKSKYLVNEFNKDFGYIFNESIKNNENVSDKNKIIELEKRLDAMERKLTFMSTLLNSFIDNKLNEDTQK